MNKQEILQAVEKIEDLGVCPEVDDLESIEEQFEEMEAYLESMYNSGIPMNTPQTQALLIVRKMKNARDYVSVKNYTDFIKRHTTGFAEKVAEMHRNSIEVYQEDIRYWSERAFKSEREIAIIELAMEERDKHTHALHQLATSLKKGE